MCGIIGYIGEDEALPILLTGLKNLEYRGYDSAGVALVSDSLDVYKKSGEIENLMANTPSESESRCGIGHTRWSTHGEPTDENAHPHVDCTDGVAVVHNGIIDNFDELRDELSQKHRFTSETDTEVIPHLIEEEMQSSDSLLDAVVHALKRVEGSYALGVVAEGRDEIIATRQDSPLIVGIGEDGNFIGSDVTAFLEHTKDVVYLEDGDIARISSDNVEVYREGKRVEFDVETIEWDADQAEKGGYKHYMLKEIHEQPQSLRQALSGRIDEVGGEVKLNISLSDNYINSLNEIQVVACGTSYHAALYTTKLLADYGDVKASAEYAHEYEFNAGDKPQSTLVVAVTQSGETADTLSAIRTAKKKGAKTLAVTNTVGSSVTRLTDETLYIRSGPEIGVAATKTFASQIATLALLSVYIGGVRGSFESRKAADVLSSLRRLPGAVQQVLDDEESVRETAEEFGEMDAFFFIGRRFGHSVALEGALKLKEISYDHAEGFPAGELKHGPLALVTPNTPVIALLVDGCRAEETMNNVKEVESRGAPVIGVSSLENAEKYLDVEFKVPDLDVMEPIVANVYLQLFAYHVADLKDRSIDKPRNLAKSVTVK